MNRRCKILALFLPCFVASASFGFVFQTPSSLSKKPLASRNSLVGLSVLSRDRTHETSAEAKTGSENSTNGLPRIRQPANLVLNNARSLERLSTSGNPENRDALKSTEWETRTSDRSVDKVASQGFERFQNRASNGRLHQNDSSVKRANGIRNADGVVSQMEQQAVVRDSFVSQQRDNKVSERIKIFENPASPTEKINGATVEKVNGVSDADKSLECDESHELRVEGGSLQTWQLPSSTERVQVSLKSGGRPISAFVEVWEGPDNTPQRSGIFIEDGKKRPYYSIIDTPKGDHKIAIRNTGQLELPLTACVRVKGKDESDNGFAGFEAATKKIQETANADTVQGRATRSYTLEPTTKRVHVVLKTKGTPLTARIELLQGPDNNKEVIIAYSEDGKERPYSVVFETPGEGHVIRIVNTATVEFPITAWVGPYVVPGMQTPIRKHSSLLSTITRKRGKSASPPKAVRGQGQTAKRNEPEKGLNTARVVRGGLNSTRVASSVVGGVSPARTVPDSKRQGGYPKLEQQKTPDLDLQILESSSKSIPANAKLKVSSKSSRVDVPSAKSSVVNGPSAPKLKTAKLDRKNVDPPKSAGLKHKELLLQKSAPGDLKRNATLELNRQAPKTEKKSRKRFSFKNFLRLLALYMAWDFGRHHGKY